MKHSVTVIVGHRPGADAVARSVRTLLEESFVQYENDVAVTSVNGISTFRIFVESEDIPGAA